MRMLGRRLLEICTGARLDTKYGLLVEPSLVFGDDFRERPLEIGTSRMDHLDNKGGLAFENTIRSTPLPLRPP